MGKFKICSFCFSVSSSWWLISLCILWFLIVSSGFTGLLLWELGKFWFEDILLQKELFQHFLGTLGGNQPWTIYFSWLGGSEYLNPDSDKGRTVVINSQKATLSPQPLVTTEFSLPSPFAVKWTFFMVTFQRTLLWVSFLILHLEEEQSLEFYSHSVVRTHDCMMLTLANALRESCISAISQSWFSIFGLWGFPSLSC